MHSKSNDVIADQNYGTRRNARLVLTLLALGYMTAMIDRMIISALIEPLRASFALTDTDVSLLQGFAFVLFYGVMAFPCAWVADRIGCKPVIIGGLIVWSVAATASAFSTGFTQLFVFRLVMGAGQAALGVGGPSLLTAVFPKRNLGRAIGIYVAGGAVGAGLALLLGGALLHALDSAQVRQAMGLSGMEPWRGATLILGVPGLVLAALMFLVYEPRQPRLLDQALVEDIQPGMNLRMLLANHPALFFWLFLLSLGYNTYSWAFVIWSPTLLVRRYLVSPAEADLVFGVIQLTLGMFGAALGGTLCDGLLRRGFFDAPARVMTILMVLAIPASLLILVPTSFPVAIISFSILTLTATCGLSLSALACQYLSPPRLRSQLIAMSGIFESVIAAFFGASLVAVITDSLFRNPDHIHLSLTLSLVGTAIAAVGAGFACTRSWRRAEIHHHP
jgi:sugar phosphate permease